MSAQIRNPLKQELRKRIKDALKTISVESRKKQSEVITKKILDSDIFKMSKRISIYLSLDAEVNTQDVLSEMFRQNKEVFVPSYCGKKMVMLKINNIDDYESLPLTKWNIKQPNAEDNRENALENGGLDLILLPGVAFTCKGARLGHGMGYYDKFLNEYFTQHPQRRSNESETLHEKITLNRTTLLGLAFKEQIVDVVPLDTFDVILDEVITAD